MSVNATSTAGPGIDDGQVYWFNDPKWRSAIAQILLVLGVIGFAAWIINNTIVNLAEANIASGYGFLEQRSGFDISQLPIEYTSDSSYGRAILIGILNTLIVSSVGIITATIIGFIVGIGRLSTNYVVRMLCTIYVETFRNIPPLLVILFWYFGVLSVLPRPGDAIELPLNSFLSNRGLQTPSAIFSPEAGFALAAFLIGIAVTIGLRFYFKQRQMKTGKPTPMVLPGLALIIGLPLVVFLLTGGPVEFEIPTASRFNLEGGFQIKPEFMAIYFALSIYTATFISEIVRAGILAVSKGQTEASMALGLTRGQTLRFVVVPQAFRVIIPPLTSQYLNLTKNSSLGLAVGYAELVAVGSTVLNQTGQSVEVVGIWMVVYLSISIVVSLFMNWFNDRMRLVER